MTSTLTVADLISPAAEIRCPCGNVLSLHAHSDVGQYGHSVSEGADRGKAVNERRCDSCGLSLTVEVWL